MHPWQFTDVDGIRTRYREAGSGAAVLLIHGGEMGSGGADTWPDELIDQLAEQHRVVAVDRLAAGHTDNPPSDVEFRMSSVIRHLRAFMDKLGLAGATVVGQSRGAFCAARLAMEFPHLVSRLVLVNSASISVRLPVEPLPGTLTHQTYYERFTGDTRADAEVMSVTYGHITDEWVAARTEVARLEKTREAAATFKRLWTDIFAEFEVLKNETLKWIIAGGHTKPTLIVWGVGDPTTTARDAFELGEIMQPHVDKLRLHLINRSGHWPHREYPDEVGSEIRQFISHT